MPALARTGTSAVRMLKLDMAELQRQMEVARKAIPKMPEFAEKIGNGCCGIDGAVFTVDGQAHLFVLSLWYQNIHLLARSMRSCRARGKL